MSPLNEKQVDRLRRQPPKSGRSLTYDNQVPGAGERVPGFGVYVTAGGVASFFLDYRTVHGRQRRHTIGRWPEMLVAQAREEASRLRVEIRKGLDPLAAKEQTRTAPTVAELAADYMKGYAEAHKRSSSVRNDRQMLEKLVLPKLGRLQVGAVTRRDLETLHHSLKATPYRANRVLALLSSMFRRGLERKWCTENPAHGIRRFDEQKRERWLSGDEIRRLLVALEEYSDQQAADAIRLLIIHRVEGRRSPACHLGRVRPGARHLDSAKPSQQNAQDLGGPVEPCGHGGAYGALSVPARLTFVSRTERRLPEGHAAEAVDASVQGSGAGHHGTVRGEAWKDSHTVPAGSAAPRPAPYVCVSPGE